MAYADANVKTVSKGQDSHYPPYQQHFQRGGVGYGRQCAFLHFANSDRPIGLYSLDVIISVGYRVKSQIGTRFRRWANSVLKEYILRGYAVNQRIEQLENRVAELDKAETMCTSSLRPPFSHFFYSPQQNPFPIPILIVTLPPVLIIHK